MDTEEKASWEVWATRLVSAGTVACLVYFVLFVDFSNHGRIWDKLAARVPALAKIIPAQSPDSGSRFTKSGPTTEDSIADRTLIVPDHSPAPAKKASAAAPVIATTSSPQAAQKQSSPPHLTSSLTPYNIDDNSQNTIINGPAARAKSTPQAIQAQAAPTATAPAQTQSSAPTAVASSKASYGAASRSEMMGQAAGPVYNLTGKK